MDVASVTTMQHMLRKLAPLALLSLAALSGCGGADGSDGTSGSADSELTNGNEKIAFEYFVGKGLSETQAAAIVGNLQQESTVNPHSVQQGGPGRGIAQWSVGARWNVTTDDNLASFAKNEGASPLSLETQLGFIWYELENFPRYGLSSLQDARTITAATVAFQKDFEACGACNSTHRVAYARAVLAAYGSGQ